MTNTELTDLMRRASDDLDPASSQRILDEALRNGARRRRGRHIAVAASAASVLAVVAGGLGIAPSVGLGHTEDTRAEVLASPLTAPTTYPPGSRTEVPGGPVIETDRKIVDDAALRAVAGDLLPPDGNVTHLVVRHVESSDPTHLADKTRNGRAISFTLDGASAGVVIQRWDGYAAVGVQEPLSVEEGRMPAGNDETAGDDPKQKAAITASEACAGSYKTFPAIECQASPEGWYSTSRPSQGASSPAVYQQLLVQLYTHDGYVVQVNSYNTPREKSGPVVEDAPVLTVDESLAMARSPRWFVAE
jgi:hypothetical protein